jgi:DNA repair protein RecO (recombination protein O)
MQVITTEGIVLKSLPFRDYDRILTIFTPQHGLIKIIANKGTFSRQKSGVSPLAFGHFVCSIGKSELWKCQEIGIINAHLELRQNLASLEAALEMLQALCLSQLEGNPAPELYLLFKIYLAKVKTSTLPRNLTASFKLKLLQFEGVLTLEGFEPEELVTLQTLAFCQHLNEIEEIIITDPIYNKIGILFESFRV